MSYGLMATEILTALLALGLLVLGLIAPKEEQKGIGYLAVAGLIGIFLVTLVNFKATGSLYQGMFLVDSFGSFFKLVFLAAGILVSLSATHYVSCISSNRGEFFALLVTATLGMMVMASAGDFVTLYIGLELMTISFYILTSYLSGNAKSSEAGLKYLILGAMSSAVLLYGMSLVYGITGTVIISQIASGIRVEPALILGLVFLLAGFGFKISAVPFQMWAPDIYEGAPTPVTAYLAVGSKAAGFVVLLRVFLSAFPDLASSWVNLVAILAAATIIFGNLVAIPQTNIKRLLAYSSIAQAGYILVGLVAVSELGAKGVMFYSMLYVFANVGAFAVAIAVGAFTGSDEIKDFAGLSQRSPFLASAMVVFLLSMAGIPPLAGFVGKFYLFAAIVEKGFLWLAFVAFVMSMVSVYYYLSVARVMFLDEPEDMTPVPISAGLRTALLVAMIVTILVGVYPAPLSELANVAASALF